jgi:hypothetical protein
MHEYLASERGASDVCLSIVESESTQKERKMSEGEDALKAYKGRTWLRRRRRKLRGMGARVSGVLWHRRVRSTETASVYEFSTHTML